MKHGMKRTFQYAFLCSLLLIFLAACNEESDLYTAPEGTVSITVGSNFSADAELSAQGVPYDPETGESGVESARLRVFEGTVNDLVEVEDDGVERELFFGAEGNLVGEEDAAPQILSVSDPAVTLVLPPGDYSFVASAEPLAVGLLNVTVTDGDTYTVPLTSIVGEVTLSAPEEVVPNEVFDVFLEVSPPGRPDLRVPAGDISVRFDVSGEVAAESDRVIGESNLGIRLAAECEEITVDARVFNTIPDNNLDSEKTASLTIPLSTTCEGTSVGVDLVPPFISITSPEADTPFSGAFTFAGEVNDMQSGVDRVEIYDGPVLLGEAELDTNVTPNTWSYEIDPDQLRDYRLIALAYDDATNENRAELEVAAPSPTDLAAVIQEAVTLENLQAHLAAWQEIADENGGNRYSGLPGYELSAEYAYNLLEEAGYEVEYQDFEYDAFAEITDSELEQVAPNEAAYTRSEDFQVQSYSGSGDVTAEVTAVDLDLGPDNESTSGCEAEDFLDFPEGNIALIQRGTCAFQTKAEFAEAAGATGVVIFNQGDAEDRTDVFGGTLTSATITTIPVLSASYDLGITLDDIIEEGLELRIAVDALRETLTTRNVIAESVAGDPDTVVMAGAHLDSVSAGPGIQDNGTGSAAILELALQMAEQLGVNSEDNVVLENRVRFALWGAEESGLIGSNFYVNNLVENDPEALEDIALYLNFDMIGSPNFIRGVYDGNQSTFEAPVPVPAGSAQLEKIFETFYEENGLAYQDVEFSGRSDYQAFINNGIPAAGLFTGAEGIKTEEEVAIYGGTAGIQYDPCYHEACDTYDNVGMEVFDENADAVAYAVVTLATSDVEEVLTAPLEPTEQRMAQTVLFASYDAYNAGAYNPDQYSHAQCNHNYPVE